MENPGIYHPLKNAEKRRYTRTVKFIGKVINSPVADISPPSPMSEYIEKYYLQVYTKDELIIEYIHGIDYNFDKLSTKKFKTIFCFEVLEHLQNPLLFMKNIVELMDDDSVLYMSIPARPKLLWPEYHYNEIYPKHFEKWILNLVGLKIVKLKFSRFNKWFSFKIGLRPVLRLFLLPINGHFFYKIMKNSSKT